MHERWVVGRWRQKRLTIASLVEAVLRVAVRCEDGDLVPAALQADSGVDDEALSAANTQIWVEEDDVLLLFRHRMWFAFPIAALRILRELHVGVGGAPADPRSPFRFRPSLKAGATGAG